MASVVVTMSGDDARLMAAHERLFAQQQKALDNYAKAIAKGKESQAQAEADAATRKKAAEAEKERLATIEKGQKLIDGQRSAQEKYNDAKAEAKRLYDAEAISASDLAKRIDILKQELRDATGETDRHREAVKKGEAVMQSTLTPIEKYNAKIKELSELERKGTITKETFTRAQKKAKEELDASRKSTDGALDSLKGMAATYITIQGAAAILNRLTEEQNQLQQASLEKTREVAAAQSDALKNLSGMSFVQQSELIGNAAEKIAKATGFGNRGAIIQGIAAGVSSGATPESSQAAVEASAKINKATPEQLATTASAAIDIGRASGLADAEKNLGFLLKTGAVSRVEGMDKLANSIAKTIGNVAATTPNVDKETATREAAAAFAVLNLRANDKITGESTATAMVQMAAYMRKFFTEGGGQTDASEQIAKLEANKLITEKESFAIKTAEEKLAKASGKDREKAQVNLNALRANATLDSIEEKKLAELKKQQEIFDNLKKQDPGSLSGRMKALQENETLRKEFLSKMPGEATFKMPMELLVTKGSEAFKEFEDNFKEIQYDNKAFTDLEIALVSATPQLAIADVGATASANIEQFNLTPQSAAIAEIRKIRQETLPRIRSPGIPGAVQSVVENVNQAAGFGNVFDGDVERSALFTKNTFQARRAMLERGGITDEERPVVELIDSQIKAIDLIVQRLQSVSDAGKTIDGAAKEMSNAAVKMSQPQSIAPAARAQAAGANRQ